MTEEELWEYPVQNIVEHKEKQSKTLFLAQRFGYDVSRDTREPERIISQHFV